ncbi:citrate synthase family protein [Pseudoroseicyclus aestuarii]|uniref:citrate synthase (unknown stereospecificity) n=1 Tax=Pseudoroseicyclus aestuarii TaxID=1795041 RepID=A0A318T550_9RHOB|nr:citrate synthase family protein [Pseudoroseicyclus aestuarii]PYE82411.1 citrate synthase [Pseudoroseicyclus aestuarii]
MTESHLDAEGAAQALGVSRATLYAYVSRGRIGTDPAPGDPRRRLYRRADIDALLQKKAQGRRPGQAAEAALDWGLPVLASGLSQIEGGRLLYRGRDAADLAQEASLEEAARLLWGCGASDPFVAPPPAPWKKAQMKAARRLPLTEGCQLLLPSLPEGRRAAWQRSPAYLWPGGAALMRAMAAAVSGTQPSDLPLHRHLAQAWGAEDGAELIRRALVLLADHELNASAFAVRVVASTGASLGACLQAGLSALSGPLHGGATSLVERLLDEVQALGAEPALEARLRRGEGVPGFGHKLYPQGDARAAALLPLLPPDAGRDRLIALMAEGSGRAPTIDVALVALRRALDLPPGAALALFAVGRSAGWVAHALEQGGEDRLIRPRARYSGPGAETG